MPKKKFLQFCSEKIYRSKDIVVFTGAGISTESGISDYRSKGGLWDRFQPVTIQEFLTSQEKRVQYWQTKCDLYHSLEKAVPNAGHKAIAELERCQKLKGVITQNIDGLHQMAGNSTEKVLELHGNNRETICLSCQDITPWQETFERLKSGDEAPLCRRCSGFLKPHTISFGQALDPQVLQTAMHWSRNCDLMIAVGSTLIVEPAASIPRIAKDNGATLIIITLSHTPLDQIADIKITSSAGECLRAVMESVRQSI